MKFEKIRDRQDYKSLSMQLARNGFAMALSEIMESARDVGRSPISFFFRDDDVDKLTPNLVRLLQLFGEREIPLHLQIIPKRVEAEAVHSLRDLKSRHPELMVLSQHGWSHANHSLTGKKHEFGETRTQAAQLLDIMSGKDKMSQLFLDDFFLAFTPPWNRYDKSTLQALKDLDFEVVSADGGKIGATDGNLVEISTAIDLEHRRPYPEMKSPVHVLYEIKEKLRTQSTIGLLLHHHEMRPADFQFLKKLLSGLEAQDANGFPNFKEISDSCRVRAKTMAENQV